VFVQQGKGEKSTHFPQTTQTWRKALDSAGKHLLPKQIPIQSTRERSNIILGYISVSFPVVYFVYALMQKINDTFSICPFSYENTNIYKALLEKEHTAI